MNEKRHQKKTDKHEKETYDVPVRKSAGADTGGSSNDTGVSGTACGHENAGIDGAVLDEPGNADSEIENAEVGNEGIEDVTAELKKVTSELEKVTEELENKTRKCEDYFNKLQRTAAEFDNFKKRSLKEKEALYTDAVGDVVGTFIPVIDNVERALQAISANDSAQSLKEGVEMVYKQFKDILKNMGVEEIKAVGGQFDPNLHNAAMHVEDDSFDRNMVVEEFQKGYIYKDRVIRYSMVKVAN